MSALAGWDNLQAEKEGWRIGHTFNEGPFIGFMYEERLPGYEPGMKPREFDAIAFVQAKAAEGSAYHIEALARTQLL